MLGLQSDTVRLCAHQEAWAAKAEEAIRALREAFGPAAVDVCHVGSTAVPDLRAKPILDLAVGVRSLPDALGRIPAVEEAGFRHVPKNDNEWQVFFSRVGEDGSVTHHVHAVLYGGPEWRRYLLFRDRLRRDERARRRYERLKLRLCEQYPNDRARYTESKQDFILALLAEEEGKR